MEKIIFECKKCGHCCEGIGGIILSGFDIVRLAKYLNVAAEKFVENYAEKHGLKTRLISVDGKCVFFKRDSGCSVHEAKPDICRAWPYFKGNMEDGISLQMAKEYCPGIYSECSFDEFKEAGKKYFLENGFLKKLDKVSAESLKTEGR